MDSKILILIMAMLALSSACFGQVVIVHGDPDLEYSRKVVFTVDERHEIEISRSNGAVDACFVAPDNKACVHFSDLTMEFSFYAKFDTMYLDSLGDIPIFLTASNQDTTLEFRLFYGCGQLILIEADDQQLPDC